MFPHRPTAGNIYRFNPANHKSYTGYISVVLSTNYLPAHMRMNLVADYKVFHDKQTSFLAASKNGIAVSYHDPGFSRGGGTMSEHLHILCKSYKGNTFIKSLFEWSKAKALGFSWAKVCCTRCAFEYLYEASGKCPVVLKTCEAFQADSCRNLIPGEAQRVDECHGPGDYEEADTSSRASSPERYSVADTDGDGPSGICPTQPGRVPDLHRSKEGTLLKLQWVRKLIEKYECTDLGEFDNVVAICKDSKAQDYYSVVSTMKEWNATFDSQHKLVIGEHRLLTWHESMLKFTVKPWKVRRVAFASKEASMMMIQHIANVNKWDLKTLVLNIRDIMDCRRPKRNTMFFYGRSNCFKSKLTYSITRSRRFQVNIAGLNRNTLRFGLACLINAPVCCLDEFEITDETKEILKSVLGGDTISTDVKYKGQCNIYRVPFFASSNYTLGHYLCRDREGFMQQMRSRVIQYNCMPIPNGQNFEGELHPGAWLDLYNHFILGQPNESLAYHEMFATYLQEERLETWDEYFAAKKREYEQDQQFLNELAQRMEDPPASPVDMGLELQDAIAALVADDEPFEFAGVPPNAPLRNNYRQRMEFDTDSE